MRTCCLLLLGLWWAVPAWASAPPEVQLSLMHLRDGERERATEALGPLERLPLYLAELEVDPEGRTVQGRVRLRLFAGPGGLTELLLRATPNAASARALTLHEVQVNGQPARVEQPEPTLFRVIPAQPVPAGEEVTVRFELEARVPRAAGSSGTLTGLLSGGGSQRGDHGAFSAAADVISLAGVFPGLVPRDAQGTPFAGPTGIGDLGLYLPANYLVSISVPASWRALATGVALGEVPDRTGKTRFSFGAAAVRDFPVLAVRGFEQLTAQAGTITVESHFSASHRAAGNQALGMAVDALGALEQRLGPLPWKVFRVVEAPLDGGAGGMEFPGLVTISRALYQAATPGGSPAAAALQQVQDTLAAQGLGNLAFPDLSGMMRQTLEFTVAHEVAHQYFAALVGSDPVQHPAVDEALAQHAALLVLEWTRGAEAAEAVRQSQLVTAYQFYRMGGGRDGPADRPTSAFGGELEYGALVYGKAPLLHDAERRLLGDKAYFAGMKAYVQEYRHRWAVADSYTGTLARLNPKHAGALRRLRQRWLSEAHGDEDLGTADLGALLKSVGGSSIPPETLELLQQFLQQAGP